MTGLPPRSRRSQTVTGSIRHHRTVWLIGYRKFIMRNALAVRIAAFATVIGLMGLFPQSAGAQAVEPISYNLRVPAPTRTLPRLKPFSPRVGAPRSRS